MKRPEGAIRRPEGVDVKRPEGAIKRPEGVDVKRPEGAIKRPEGVDVKRPEGARKRPESVGVTTPEGAQKRPEGVDVGRPERAGVVRSAQNGISTRRRATVLAQEARRRSWLGGGQGHSEGQRSWHERPGEGHGAARLGVGG